MVTNSHENSVSRPVTTSSQFQHQTATWNSYEGPSMFIFLPISLLLQTSDFVKVYLWGFIKFSILKYMCVRLRRLFFFPLFYYNEWVVRCRLLLFSSYLAPTLKHNLISSLFWSVARTEQFRPYGHTNIQGSILSGLIDVDLFGSSAFFNVLLVFVTI